MSARVMRLRRFSLRVLTFSGRQLSWCTALMPTARCAWSKNFAAPVDMPSTFHFISWKIEFEISGRGERQKSEGQRARAKSEESSYSLCPLLLARLVARDGIEPPTPAFSEPPTESPKWFEINGLSLSLKRLW